MLNLRVRAVREDPVLHSHNFKLIQERSGRAVGWEVGFLGFDQRVVLGALFNKLQTGANASPLCPWF
jgi:hypothetical protein